MFRRCPHSPYVQVSQKWGQRLWSGTGSLRRKMSTTADFTRLMRSTTASIRRHEASLPIAKCSLASSLAVRIGRWELTPNVLSSIGP